MTERINVLDHGYVELVDSMGSDLSVVNGARQSFDEVSVLHHPGCESVCDGKSVCNCKSVDADLRYVILPGPRTHLAKKDAGLINFLMRERHTSPFELAQVQCGVQLPIFVAREWMRHRTQSFNEMSGRYTKLPRLFYVPDEIREQKGKPGAYYYERMEDGSRAKTAQDLIHDTSDNAFDQYEFLLDSGVAKEQARLVLPVNTYTKMVVSANLLNWMRFLSLRNHTHAQQEIRVYAEAIEKLLHQIAPVSMDCFVKYGRLTAK